MSHQEKTIEITQYQNAKSTNAINRKSEFNGRGNSTFEKVDWRRFHRRSGRFEIL